MKEATGHGGLRAGAGRKRLLDYLSELHVGARADNYQRRIAERRAMSKHRATMERLGITDAQKKAVEILRTEGPEYWDSSYEGEYTRDDIIGGLANYHGDLQMEDPPRLISIPISLHGTRDQALVVVSRWASWYYAQWISPERVHKCLKLYRAFQKDS